MILFRRSLIILVVLAVFLATSPACLAQKNAYIQKFAPPVQNYAVIDISGTLATSPVTMVALNDDNKATFGFNTGNAVPNVAPYTAYQVYTWSNGTVVPLAPINWVQAGGYDAMSKITSWSVSDPEWLTSGGAVYANSFDEDIYDSGGQMWYYIGMFGCPNLPDPPYGKSSDGKSNVYYNRIYCVSDNGYVGGSGRAALPDGAQPRFCRYGFIKDPTGNFTVFQDNQLIGLGENAPRPVDGKVTVNPNTFYPQAVNNRGQVVGDIDDSGTWVFWDGTALTPIGKADGFDLNDQGQVVGGDLTGYPNVSSSGYLWENKKSVTFSDVLAYWAASVYHDIQPFSISNQVKAAPADGPAPLDTDTTIHILTSAEGQEVGKFGMVVWTRDNNGKWSFANIALPDGTTIDDFTTINSSGVIAAIGNGGHALLLVPVMLTNLVDPAKQHNNLDTQIFFQQNDTDANINSVAWIAAHDPQNSDAPRMPSLVANAASILGINYNWKLQVVYHDRFQKKHRDFDTGPVQDTAVAEDTVTIPNSGWQTISNGTSWKIYQHPGWITEVTKGFFGGEAVLSLEILDTNENKLSSQQDYKFRIAGENPIPSKCESYINELYNGPTPNWTGSNSTAFLGFWFAYAIAKSETADNGGRPFYNHFMDDGAMHQGSASTTPVPLKRGHPTWNNDGLPDPTSGSGGYGLFQLTYDSTDPNFKMPRNWIWNWQSNSINVLAEFNQKLAINRDYVKYVQRIHPEAPDPSSQTVTISHTTLNFWESSIITLYNGGSVPLKEITVNNGKKTVHHHLGAWSYSPGTGWHYVQNSQGYLTKVVRKGIETPTR